MTAPTTTSVAAERGSDVASLVAHIEELACENRTLKRKLHRTKVNLQRAEERQSTPRAYLIAAIDQLKASQSELRQAQEELVESEALANAATEAKSRFLANMSHELRTPLNAIIGYTELIAETDDDFKNELGAILGASRNLLALIDDILDLSKIEAGYLQIKLVSFPLRALLDDVVVEFRPLFAEKGLKFSCDCAHEGDVFADSFRVRQVITNLLSNAVKFTPEGDIALRVHPAGEQTAIAISDTGIGMSPEEQERVFAPFAQADATTTRRFGGTGLGLSISRSLAESMGGSLDVESTAGIGSVFTLTIPTTGKSEATPTPVQQRRR